MAQNLGNLFIDGEGGVIQDITGNHSITNDNNSVVVSTADKRFGTSSLYFDLTTDKLIVPDSDDFFFGTGNFTIDFWIKSPLTNQFNAVYEQRGAGIDDIVIWADGISPGYVDNGITFYSRDNGTNIAVANTPTNSITANTWHHVAVVKYGTGENNLKIFIDGIDQTLTWATTMAANTSFGNIPVDATVGFSNGAGGGMIGYLDNFRLVKGAALWESNFSLNEVALFYTASVNPDRPDLITQLYNLSSVKGNLRGKGQSFIRPTLKQYFTSVDFTEIIKAPQGGGTTFLGYGNNLATEGANVSASTYHGTRLPEHVVNGGTTQTDTDGWSSNGSELGANDPWIMYDFGDGNAKIIGKMSFIGYTNGNDVRDFVLEASNDNSSWTSLLTDVGYNGATEYVKEFVNSTAYRYYRVRVTSHWYSDGWCGMVDWKLYEALYGLKYTDDLCITTSNAIASSYFGSTPPSNAFNDVYGGAYPANLWESLTGEAFPQWIGYNFGVATQIEKYTVRADASYYNDRYAPRSWEFQGSNGGSWTTLNTVTDETFTSPNELKEYTFVNHDTYTMYRLLISENLEQNVGTQAVILDEIEMMEVNPYTADLCEGGTATADIWWSSWTPAAAFDDNTGTGWHSSPQATGKLQYQFTSAKQIEKYTIRSRYLNNSECPRIWTFEGSNDAIDWTVLDTQTDNAALDGAYVAEYPISNTNSYTYYRLNITASQGGASISIMEVEMMEKYR